jgi:hypothetical protein
LGEPTVWRRSVASLAVGLRLGRGVENKRFNDERGDRGEVEPSMAEIGGDVADWVCISTELMCDFARSGEDERFELQLLEHSDSAVLTPAGCCSP